MTDEELLDLKEVFLHLLACEDEDMRTSSFGFGCLCTKGRCAHEIMKEYFNEDEIHKMMKSQ